VSPVIAKALKAINNKQGPTDYYNPSGVRKHIRRQDNADFAAIHGRIMGDGI
jgi:hypothetical protein